MRRHKPAATRRLKPTVVESRSMGRWDTQRDAWPPRPFLPERGDSVRATRLLVGPPAWSRPPASGSSQAPLLATRPRSAPARDLPLRLPAATARAGLAAPFPPPI